MHLNLARSRLAPAVYGMMAISKSALALVLGAGLASLGLGPLGLVLGLTLGLLIAALPACWSELRGPPTGFERLAAGARVRPLRLARSQ